MSFRGEGSAVTYFQLFVQFSFSPRLGTALILRRLFDNTAFSKTAIVGSPLGFMIFQSWAFDQVYSTTLNVCICTVCIPGAYVNQQRALDSWN